MLNFSCGQPAETLRKWHSNERGSETILYRLIRDKAYPQIQSLAELDKSLLNEYCLQIKFGPRTIVPVLPLGIPFIVFEEMEDYRKMVCFLVEKGANPNICFSVDSHGKQNLLSSMMPMCEANELETLLKAGATLKGCSPETSKYIEPYVESKLIPTLFKLCKERFTVFQAYEALPAELRRSILAFAVRVVFKDVLEH